MKICVGLMQNQCKVVIFLHQFYSRLATWFGGPIKPSRAGRHLSKNNILSLHLWYGCYSVVPINLQVYGIIVNFLIILLLVSIFKMSIKYFQSCKIIRLRSKY
jgi:hypothetical protein